MVVDRKWVMFGIAMLFAVGCYVFANVYWFYPMYSVQVEPPPVYQSPKSGLRVGENIELFKVTRELMIEDQETNNEGLIGSGADRNPFLWEGELQPEDPPKPLEVDSKPEQPLEIPKLSMILNSSSGKSAMLNETLVHQGESYAGHTVENIESDYIILSGEYGVLKISMLAKSFGECKVDILEVSNPDMLIKPVVTRKK